MCSYLIYLLDKSFGYEEVTLKKPSSKVKASKLF